MTVTGTFVDTDILIDVARKVPRAVDFWRRAETKGPMLCSVISTFELLAGCQNPREQRTTLKSLATVETIQVETGDSIQALDWYRTFHLAQGIGFLDCFIAAATVRIGCSVHTLNVKHFRTIPGLQVKRSY
jgi:predicted nucleic acid-binding protein